jgi:2-keto-3-deoxy-L-rhamnonate aldolase RhmA
MRRVVFVGLVFLAFALVALPAAQQAAQAPSWSSGTGAVKITPVDPARPWGWATRDFMENPSRKLYNKAKAKLLSGQQVFSFTQSRFDPKGYCDAAPHYDFTWFEMQHSMLRFDQVQDMILACPGIGATPILRVPDALEGNMQKAYDLGVLGTIVPTVDDALEARDAARFARFPPQGRRSQGGSQVWNPFLNPGETYRNSINDNVLTIVMLETPTAVENALEIASTPGIDVVIQGNSDLESFSGVPRTDPRYQDMLTIIRNATYKAGKFWGNATFQMAKGNVLSPDSRLHQNGPSNDGWTPPPAAPAAAPAAPPTPGAKPAAPGAKPAAPPAR